MELFVGVDVGTSSSKVVAIDDAGKIVAEASSPHQTQYLDALRVEQDPDDWVHSATQALKELGHRVDLKDIKAIAFTGQMIGLVCVDREGRPVRPAIIWIDQRSQPIAQEIELNHGSLVEALVYNPVNVAYTLPRILWMKKNEPEKWNLTWKWMLPKDYVKFRFCGIAVTDFSDASGTLLFEVPRLKWSDTLVSLFAVEQEKMPELASSLTVVGRIGKEIATELGLQQDVVVVNGCADLIGESFVAYFLNPQHFLIRFGSAGSISTVVGHPKLDSSHCCTCYAHAITGKWIVETSSQGFGVCERWFREGVLDKSPEEVFEALETRINSWKSQRLIFIPPIKGAPYWNSRQTGAFLGLSLDVEGGDMFRAVLEGACFSLKDAREQLYKVLDDTSREYLFAGGGVRSKAWASMLANIFGVSAKVVRAEPSIGAAIMATQALSVNLDYKKVCVSLIGEHVECSGELVNYYYDLYRTFSEARRRIVDFYPLLFGSNAQF